MAGLGVASFEPPTVCTAEPRHGKPQREAIERGEIPLIRRRPTHEERLIREIVLQLKFRCAPRIFTNKWRNILQRSPRSSPRSMWKAI
jgi:hypothetical protein